MPSKAIISWDEYFMGIAKLSSMRSKDPNTRVGACIVGDENIIISTGYNGFPRGCHDSLFPWDKDAISLEESKYAYVVHAEANAILNAGKQLKGATLYVTLFPCHECVKLIIQSGISKILYEHDFYKDLPSDKAAKRMLLAAHVQIKQIKTSEIILKNT